MTTPYRLFLFLHVLGVILWVGLAVALPFVTGRATREAGGETTAFAYRVSDRLMRTLGLAGIVLTVAGGVAMVAMYPGWAWFQPFPDHWLFLMEVLGLAAAAVAAAYQIPLGRKLAREAERSAEEGEPTEAFSRYRKRNAIVGSAVGLVLLALVVLGTVRPI